MSTERYATSFELYTAHTNGKTELAKHIAAIAKETGAHSLLDIGSGDGDLLRKLSYSFTRITAVEKTPLLRDLCGLF